MFSYRDVGRTVGKYLDWEALELWVRPLFASHAKMPPQVISELERRCPEILECLNPGTPRHRQEKSKISRQLIRWWKDHCLSDPREAGWLDFLLQRVQSHPRHLRLVVYGKYWAKTWPKNRPQPYPSYRPWRRAADRYVKVGPNSDQLQSARAGPFPTTSL